MSEDQIDEQEEPELSPEEHAACDAHIARYLRAIKSRRLFETIASNLTIIYWTFQDDRNDDDALVIKPLDIDEVQTALDDIADAMDELEELCGRMNDEEA